MPATRTSNATAVRAVADKLTAAGWGVTALPGRPDQLDLTDGDHPPARTRVRAGHLGDGCLHFTKRTTDSDADTEPVQLWAVWSPDLDAGYLVPDDVACDGMARLRLERPRNRQVLGVIYADDYRIGARPAPRHDEQLVEKVSKLAKRYRTGRATRREVATLQTDVAELVAQTNVADVERRCGITRDQVRVLARAHTTGRVAGFDSKAGRKSKDELRPLAAALIGHPQAGRFEHLLADDPSRFLFELAVAATDGRAPSVIAFLAEAGWHGISRGTVHRRLAQMAEAR